MASHARPRPVPRPSRPVWLVTGGAGYIGAHVVAAMLGNGNRVVVLDDLTTGDRSRIPGVPLVVGSVLDEGLVARTVRDAGIHGIVHIAGKKQVEESVRRPLFYYHENVEGMRVLLEVASDAGARSFVFSSSAAVYGAPDVDLIDEEVDCRPVNPYGSTKLVCERMLEEAAGATELRYTILRYFNVAGAATTELSDTGASNLVPMLFQQLARRRGPRIFGDDYPTPDGTCIRDFIHPSDIASAHVAAVNALEEGRVTALTANVGRGDGVSVREMASLVRAVTGTDRHAWAEPVIEPRRAGDPARVVASPARIHATLGWRARFGVEEMVASAWRAWTARATRPGRRAGDRRVS